MRVAIIGQQAFGKSVLQVFLNRGDTIAGVFAPPEKPSGRPADPLKVAAEEYGVRLFQLPTLKSEAAVAALRALDVDLAVMAYVLQFASRAFVDAPRHGAIQYHPSLLPKYRGPSAINWPIIKGDAETGLTVFRPTEGVDEGPVILQKAVAIGPDDTAGHVYFGRLFPLGVEAMLEAADLVVSRGYAGSSQDEGAASYEGWCSDAEARINWNAHIDVTYNLIRGCDPAPGAWTTFQGRKLGLFAAKKHPVRRFSDIRAKPGEICAIGEESIRIAMHGGEIQVFKVRAEGREKISAAAFAREVGLNEGTRLDAELPRAAAA
ncbi:MAG: methionyl-tRNA formyltransferase [Acetobacteraceae bacterium]